MTAMISIFTLTSPLHDKAAVDAVTKDFLDSLGVEYSFKGDDYEDYGSDLSLIYVRTGGTEGLFPRFRLLFCHRGSDEKAGHGTDPPAAGKRTPPRGYIQASFSASFSFFAR